MTTTDPSPATAENQNILAAVSYLGGFVTGIIILLVEKKNEYVRFHAMQSTILSLGIVILTVGLEFVPFIGFVVNRLVGLVAFIVWIVLLWKSFSGEHYKLPYIGELAEKQLGKLK